MRYPEFHFDHIEAENKGSFICWLECVYGCLVFFKAPRRQCSLICGLFYVSRVVSSHLVYSGFSCTCSLHFVLCLILVLGCFPYTSCWKYNVFHIENTAAVLQEEDVKLRRRKLEWDSWQRTRSLGRRDLYKSAHKWVLHLTYLPIRKDERNLDLMSR